MDTQAEMARLKERHSAAVRVVCNRKQPQAIRDGADKVAKNLAWAMLLLEAMEVKKKRINPSHQPPTTQPITSAP